MKETERAERRVERAVELGEIRCIARLKAAGRDGRTGDRHHGRGRIDPDRLGAECGRSAGGVARTAAHVDGPAAGRDTGGGERGRKA